MKELPSLNKEKVPINDLSPFLKLLVALSNNDSLLQRIALAFLTHPDRIFRSMNADDEGINSNTMYTR